MDEITETRRVHLCLAKEVREELRSRVRLKFTERRRWLGLRIDFTITGPRASVDAALADIEAIKDAQWTAEQW